MIDVELDVSGIYGLPLGWVVMRMRIWMTQLITALNISMIWKQIALITDGAQDEAGAD